MLAIIENLVALASLVIRGIKTLWVWSRQLLHAREEAQQTKTTIRATSCNLYRRLDNLRERTESEGIAATHREIKLAHAKMITLTNLLVNLNSKDTGNLGEQLTNSANQISELANKLYAMASQYGNNRQLSFSAEQPTAVKNKLLRELDQAQSVLQSICQKHGGTI